MDPVPLFQDIEEASDALMVPTAQLFMFGTSVDETNRNLWEGEAFCWTSLGTFA